MNIVDFLKENNCKIYESGKNVAKGYVNIQCMFCDDRTNHLGFKISNPNRVVCWKCGPKKAYEVIAAIVNCSNKEARKILSEIDVKKGRSLHDQVDIDYKLSKFISLPKECEEIFPKSYLNFMKKQYHFSNPKKIVDKYNLKAVKYDGEYCYRIIIPVYLDNKLVSFTSRDVTNKQTIKYKSSSKYLIDPSEVIFNFDSVQKNQDAFLVEGPFDVMKMGDQAFCFLGVEMTQKRLLRLLNKQINNLYVFLDSDPTGRRKTMQYMPQIAPCVKKLHVLKLKNESDKKQKLKDPGDMSEDEIRKLRLALGFKI